MTIGDVDLAVPGDNVTLSCSATGDTPLTYQWTMQGNSTVLNSNNSTGTLELVDIQESQFGTYTCTVTNDLGEGTDSVDLERASKSIPQQIYRSFYVIFPCSCSKC